MRMLQKCNTRSTVSASTGVNACPSPNVDLPLSLTTCVLACLFASLSGCAMVSSNASLADYTSPASSAPQIDAKVNATKIATTSVPAVATPSAVAQTVSAPVTSVDESDTLSARTTAPEGFKKFMGIFTPYRITIQQGNFVSQEMISQVKLGMTREQVRFLLGTALLTDMFHADRWDYPFRLLKPSGELITSRVAVHFEKNLVVKIDSGTLPSENEYLARISEAAIVGYVERADVSHAPKPKAPTPPAE